MALQFCSFASGSAGNCYLMRSQSTTLLVDVGISGKRILTDLAARDIRPEQIDGILLTHEHTDHIRSLRTMTKKIDGAAVYGSGGTLAQVETCVPASRRRTVEADNTYQIGDIEVLTFALSHDAAEPVGYAFRHDGRQVTVITDTGCLSPEMERQMAASDLLVLEANHEVNLLKIGNYPYPLKRRILSDRGHLSNEAAGAGLCRMLQARAAAKACAKTQGRAGAVPAPDTQPPTVVLAHLSRENNAPELAYLTIRNLLFDAGFYPEKDLMLYIADREEAGPWMTV